MSEQRGWLDRELSRICAVHDPRVDTQLMKQRELAAQHVNVTNLTGSMNNGATEAWQFSSAQNYGSRPGYPFEGAALTDSDVRRLEGKS